MMRKLGKTQQDVLNALREHGSWHLHCGWVWGTPSNTQRVMDSLVRAGYATVATPDNNGRRVYKPIGEQL